MLDKNPDQILDNNLELTKIEFTKTNPSILLCDMPLIKTAFLNQLINSLDYKIIYLDFDLLYSGYIVSGLLQENDRVSRYHIDNENWNEVFSEILDKVSKEKFLIIIDSLNGMNNCFVEKESARFINSSIMLLASCGDEIGSRVLAAGMARKKDSKWVLVPGGRQIIESKNSRNYFLEERKGEFLVTSKDKSVNKILKVQIQTS